jgi:hypothetical protein
MELSLENILPEIFEYIMAQCGQCPIMIISLVSRKMKLLVTQMRVFPNVKYSQFSLCEYGVACNSLAIMEWALDITRFIPANTVTTTMVKQYMTAFVVAYKNGYPYMWDVGVGYIAAIHGHLPVLQWLYKYGYRINMSALHEAIVSGHLEIIKWFLKSEKRHHTIPPYNEWILDVAAMNGHLKIIQWLLKDRHRGNVYDLEIKHKTLKVAVKYGKLEIIKWLHVSSPSKFMTMDLHDVIIYGHLDILQWANQNGYLMDYSMYWTAIQYGRIQILAWLMNFE